VCNRDIRSMNIKMADPTSIVICLVTAPSREVATALATKLVDKRLVACVNVVPGVQSIYRWKDEIVIDEEVLMIIKTDQRLASELQSLIISEHPYEVPEFVVIKPQDVSASYAQWVVGATERS
jgi:periplasmic divalent cation tolerance protein